MAVEATIEIKESEYEDAKIEYTTTFFGRLKHRIVPLGTKKRYSVELTVIPSEEERAIVVTYKIDELWMESERKYTDKFLQKFERDQMLIMLHDHGEIAERALRENIDQMREEKTYTLIGQYFDNPYVKNFDVRQDAHLYADKLEREILPFIRDQIGYYRAESLRQDKRQISL